MTSPIISALYDRNLHSDKFPERGRVECFVRDFITLLFPVFGNKHYDSLPAFEAHFHSLQEELCSLMGIARPEDCDCRAISEQFFNEIPALQSLIQDDVKAMYDGDPAAQSEQEIIRAYPGFCAIASFRMAHALQKMGVPVLPRIITEVAHSQTGIDIHPGAEIGRFFCIDHGTGVVIGETTHIGNWVKIYQGVTLGGLSVDKADARKKRHPTIEDGVVIYAGATILGGDTVVGTQSIIGGNVWLTQSVPPHSKVYYRAAMSHKDGETDTIEFKS